MTKRKLHAGAAIAANLLFWASVAGFGAIREGYSHLDNPVSFLGVVGSPHALAFNVLGYGAPGLLLAVAGWGIGRSAAGWVTAALLAMAGVSIALSGIFPADLYNMDGMLTQLHTAAGSLGLLGILGWIVLAVRAWRTERMLAVWGIAGLALFLLTFGAYAVTEHDGLVQRLRFAVALGWYPVAALILLRAPRKTRIA